MSMKKILLSSLLCVVFLFSIVITPTFALESEKIEFRYDNMVFSYSLSKNIKTSSQFDIDYSLNKYNRFGSTEQRQTLLKHMLSAGFEPKICVNYLFPNIDLTIKKIEKTLNLTAKNATIDINTNRDNVFVISKEKTGRQLDVENLYLQICKNYLTTMNLNIKLNFKKIEPAILSSQLEKNTYLRSSFSTNITSSSADRKHNIKNAMTSLNLVEVYPNQIFSFNNTIGKRTKANGYREAKIIINNEFVDGIGGGVCQVSSTLYNAVLLSGLEIIEANKHSRQVNYVKYGFDAMVNYGSSDLKFRNNTKEKITIVANYSPNQIKFRIYGENMNNVKYKLRNEIISTTEPGEIVLTDEKQEYADKVQFEDEFFYLKKGIRGMEVKSYRDKYIDEQLVKHEILRTDKFKMEDAIKIYGIKKRTEICAS